MAQTTTNYHFGTIFFTKNYQQMVPKMTHQSSTWACLGCFLIYFLAAFGDHFYWGKWYHGPFFIFWGTLSTPNNLVGSS